ncbi:MAG: hypothetical protein IPM51_11905 [Sphingobacteriaceae bacterium]|nr:hypothetical protein [Sphingobacteriaceae bacterium]
MFKTIFNLIKNEIGTEALNMGFMLENRAMPYIAVNPVSATVDTQYSTSELLLQYSFHFRIYSENRKQGKNLQGILINLLRGYSDTEVSNIHIPRVRIQEIRPQLFIIDVLANVFTLFTKNLQFDALIGTGLTVNEALFDLYKQSNLPYKIVFSDYMLENENYPYIVLTSIDEVNMEDRSCEAIYQGDYELVLFNESLPEADKIINKLIDLYHSGKIQCSEYNVEEFMLQNIVFTEVRPQLWQTNLIFNYQHND